MGIRIGGASAFYGDSQLAARQLVDHGDINYLVFDYLAEVTMAILARAASKNSELGYALDFVNVAMADVLADCARKGIKVVANAGGVNVPGCVAALEALCQQQGLDLKIAGVYGDNLVARDDLPLDVMAELQSGEAYPDRPASSNAYFGAAPIADALAAGADVVVTGRVVDSAVVLGPLIHEYKWALDDYDRLAQGALCGHVIECGAQCTGGNFTDWHLVPDFSNMSYPVADVDASGDFSIGIPSGSGGIATVGSVAEQIVYEIGDPANYLLPDVACDFSYVSVEQVAEDVVRVAGAKGRAPGDQYKVCATWVDGFRLTSSFFMAGPKSANKARTALDAWLARTRKVFSENGWGDYRRVSIEIAGAEDTYGPHSNQQDSREVMGKYGVHHDHKEALIFASMEMAYLATSGPPAMTGFGAGRARPQPLMRVHSTMINKSAVPVIVQLGNKVIIKQCYSNEASSVSQSPSIESIAAPDTSLVMQTVSLETLAYARSGDKGDNANIGLICRKPEYLPYIQQQVSADVVTRYLAHLVDGDVTRFYLPGFHAFNFYLTKALGGGGTASLRLDSQAKTYAQMLLSLEIRIPKALL
ncbi:MAG: hypothetical protein ACI9SP_004119 [Arenicella sp.]|jgi:hypothetical protein